MTIPGKTLVCAAAVLGLAVCAFIAWPMRVRALHGANDFVPLYAGARLALSGNLYNPTQVMREEREETGVWSADWPYTRLPFYAVLSMPLGAWRYGTAYFCWQMLLLTATAGFAFLWPVPRWIAVLGCCWAYPLMVCFANGQDDAFLIFAAALAARVVHRRPALAGSILAFGLIKYHLFLLVPAVLAALRRWRATAGFAATGVVLLAISFAAAGPRWPVEYVAMLRTAQVNPRQDMMPTLHAMFIHSAPAAEVIASGLIGLVVLLIASRADFASGVAIALTGGVLIGYHVYTHDCTLVIPAALLALQSTSISAMRILAVWLLLPLAQVLRYLKLPFSSAYQVTLMVFLGLAWASSRNPKQPLDHGSGAASRGSP